MSWLRRLTGGGKEERKRGDSPREPARPDPAAIEAAHRRWTPARVAALEELFGCAAKSVFPVHDLEPGPEDPFLIDVFVFELATQSQGDIEVAVTNGMSDLRMVDPEDPSRWGRRELIQYFPSCTKEHARRRRDMAWLPLHDGFFLDTRHTIAWNQPAVPGTPWTSAFFLQPLPRSHQAFEMTVDGDPVSLLWHIPITEKEREYKTKHGADALIDRLQEVELPWIFDEKNRPPLVA